MRRLLMIVIVIACFVLLCCPLSSGETFVMQNGEVLTGKLVSFDGRTFWVLTTKEMLRIEMSQVEKIKGNSGEGVVSILAGVPSQRQPDRITGTIESAREGELWIRTAYGYVVITSPNKVTELVLKPPVTQPEPTIIVKVTLRSEPLTFDSESYIIRITQEKGFSYPKAGITGNFQLQYKMQTLQKVKVIVAHNTNLMWQQSGSFKLMDWTEATNYIHLLNKKLYAGFSDWRLPTVEELASLLGPTKQKNGLYINPVFDIKPDTYWSSDREPRRGFWWGMKYFFGAASQACSDTCKCYVLAVRSLQ